MESSFPWRHRWEDPRGASGPELREGADGGDIPDWRRFQLDRCGEEPDAAEDQPAGDQRR